jgi:putative copper export protein
MYGLLLFLHILAATIWTGGHIVLATVVLPRALRERSPESLLQFERGYEKIGIPALLVQGNRSLPLPVTADFPSRGGYGTL